MAYNCLLLDMDDTLLSFKDSERYALTKVLEKYNIPATEENLNTYHEINDSLWQDLEKGKIKKHFFFFFSSFFPIVSTLFLLFSLNLIFLFISLFSEIRNFFLKFYCIF